MTARLSIAALAGVMLLAAGCDDSPAAKSGALPQPTFGNATLAGTVRFVGDAPQLPMIDTRGTCKDVAPIQEETIVVDRAGGLRDVVVWLADAPASSGFSQPIPTLDQVGCRYEPHVIGVQVEQPLKIKTSDAEYHNVHWNGGANPAQNFGLSKPGESKTAVFNRPEFLRTKCDIHPWMEAYIAVMPNPFFGVTDREGRFTIGRVPAGRYQAKTWHPLLGERTAAVTIAADGTATLDFEYAKPKR